MISYLEKLKNFDKKDEVICIVEVNENLRRVKLGMELTRPLRQLNKNCHFKKKYDEMFNIWEADKINKERSDYLKEYKTKNKKKVKEYNKKYRKINIEKIRKFQKSWRENHKEKLREYMKNYRRNNE